MNVALGIAALACLCLAVGHTALGLRAVLPALTKERLTSPPLGPQAMTVGMIRVTWHLVTVVLLAFGAILAALTLAAAVDPRTLVLRWVAGTFLAISAMMLWMGRRRPHSLLRRPVWSLNLVIAALCWWAST